MWDESVMSLTAVVYRNVSGIDASPEYGVIEVDAETGEVLSGKGAERAIPAHWRYVWI